MTVPRHLDESALARILDDQVDRHDRVAWQAHVNDCAECQSALKTLADQARSVTDFLIKSDVPVPQIPLTRRRRVSLFRYGAAAVAAGVLFVVAIAPVRAWVTDHVLEIGGRFLGVAQSADEVTTGTAPAAAPNRVVVSVPLDGDVLRIRLTNRQRQGTLSLSVGNISTATAEVAGGGAERLVLSDGLIIANQATSTASYHVIVRANLKVEVVVGEEPAVTFTLSDDGVSRGIGSGPEIGFVSWVVVSKQC